MNPRLSAERKRLLNQASEIVATASGDDLLRSDVIDAALTHLIQSVENIKNTRRLQEDLTAEQEAWAAERRWYNAITSEETEADE